MLYWLADFSSTISIFNVFRYLTVRTGGAMFTAMLLVFLFGPWIIDHLRLRQGKGQPIREDGPQSHLIAKRGTPTMGGLMILFGVTVSTVLWANPRNPYVWIVLGVTLCFGLIGFYDDYMKVTKQTHAGSAKRVRLLAEAIVPVMIAALSFGLIAYLAGNAVFADYLQIHYVAGAGELAVLCGAVIGAGLGFLWFNAPPASIFMGDTGSLALGGLIGTIAVATKHEVALAIIGGLFVLEAVSVIVQVVSFKVTGKRVFRMAPLHHHFEQLGWTEPQIVIRFWIISIVLALAGLSTLKLR